MNNPFTIYMGSLGDTRCQLVKDIPITVFDNGDEDFVVHYLDANVGSGGSPLTDAIFSLQNVLAECYIRLKDTPDDMLGPAMQRTKRVLTEVIKEKS